MTTSSVINHCRKEEDMMRRRKRLEMMEGRVTHCDAITNDSTFSNLRLSPNLALTSSGVCGPISIGLGSPLTGLLATVPPLPALLVLAAALICKLLRVIMDLLDRDVKDMDGAVKASMVDDEDRAATNAAMGSSAVNFMALVELCKRVEAGGYGW